MGGRGVPFHLTCMPVGLRKWKAKIQERSLESAAGAVSQQMINAINQGRFRSPPQQVTALTKFHVSLRKVRILTPQATTDDCFTPNLLAWSLGSSFLGLRLTLRCTAPIS